MADERFVILQLLSEGKITVDEADRLIAAIDDEGNEASGLDTSSDEHKTAITVDFEGLRNRVDKVVGEMIEAGQEFPDRVRKRLEKVEIRTGRGDDRKSISLLSFLSSLGIGDPIGGVRAKKILEGTLAGKEHPIVLDLGTDNGHIWVGGWDRPDYRITVIGTVRGASSVDDAERRLAECVQVSADQGLIRVRPYDSRTSGTMSIEASIPKSLAYDVEAGSSNGAIVVEGVSVDRLDCKSTNGRVVAEDITGRSIHATSVNGGITVKADVAEARCQTTNGSISAYLRSTSPGRMEFTTTNGSIRIYIPRARTVVFDVQGTTSVGDIRAAVENSTVSMERHGLGLGRRLHLRTGSSEHSEPTMKIEARTSNGSISVEES